MPMGRPTEFSPAVGLEITTRLADGESVRSICKEEDMPSKATVFRWLLEADISAIEGLKDFRDQYRFARRVQLEDYAEELVEISDNVEGDLYETEDGRQKVDYEHINRSKLRVNTRQWLLARMLPKKYGDRVEHSGKVGVGSVQLEKVRDAEHARELMAEFLGEGSEQPDYWSGDE